MAGEIAFFVGALVPTLLVSRLLLVATRGWKRGGVVRLFCCNAGSLLIASALAGIGMADGGAFAGTEALITYAPAQAVWLIVDLVRTKRRPRQEGLPDG